MKEKVDFHKLIKRSTPEEVEARRIRQLREIQERLENYFEERSKND